MLTAMVAGLVGGTTFAQLLRPLIQFMIRSIVVLFELNKEDCLALGKLLFWALLAICAAMSIFVLHLLIGSGLERSG